MTNYENMSTDEFSTVLRGCQNMSQVLAVQESLLESTIRSRPRIQGNTLNELRQSRDKAMAHLKRMDRLNAMISGRIIQLAKEGKTR